MSNVSNDDNDSGDYSGDDASPFAANAAVSLSSLASSVSAQNAANASAPSVNAGAPSPSSNARTVGMASAISAGGAVPADIVWSVTGWTIDLPGAPIPLEGEKQAINAASLFAVAGIPLPKKATLENFKVNCKIQGDERTYHAESEKIMAVARANGLEFYIETPVYKAIQRVLTIINNGHLLTTDVGGSINPMAAITAKATPAPLTYKLACYIKGAVEHVKYIYSVVYNALMEALVEEQHVTKTMQTLLQKLPTLYPEGTPLTASMNANGTVKDEEQLGSNADPHALWIMLRKKYQPNHRRHVNQLLDVVDNTSCEANTRQAVQLFFTKLRSLEQELGSIQGISPTKTAVYIAIVERRRRNGLTSMLKLELDTFEQISKKEFEGIELERWAEQTADNHDQSSTHGMVDAVSAIQINPHPGKQTGPGSNRPAMRCDYCHQRGSKYAGGHDTINHHNLPKGWKKGDPIAQPARQQPRRKETQTQEEGERPKTRQELLEENARLKAAVNNNKTSTSSYSTPPKHLDWNGEVAALTITEERMNGQPVYEMKVSEAVFSITDGVDHDIDRQALLDSGSTAMLAPNAKLAKGAVKKLDFVAKLTMANRQSCMYATECMTMTLAKDLYIENVLIVPSMKNIIISETKLREQNLGVVDQDWQYKNVKRVLNPSHAGRGEAPPRYDKEVLLQFKKTGAANKAGTYWHTIPLEAIKHNKNAEPLSNGKIFNIGYGARRDQETKLAQMEREKAAREAAAANSPASPPTVIPKKTGSASDKKRKELERLKAERDKRMANSLATARPPSVGLTPSQPASSSSVHSEAHHNEEAGEPHSPTGNVSVLTNANTSQDDAMYDE